MIKDTLYKILGYEPLPPPDVNEKGKKKGKKPKKEVK